MVKTDEHGAFQFDQEFIDSEEWRLVLGEVLRASDSDPSLLEMGWSTFETISATDPNRTPVDRVVPGWDSLTPQQQQAIVSINRLPQWSELSFAQSEAFRRAFERMLGRVVLNAAERMVNRMKEKPRYG